MPSTSEGKVRWSFQCWVLPRAMERAKFVSSQTPKTRNGSSFDLCLGHFSCPASLAAEFRSGLRLTYPAGKASEAMK